MTLRAALQSSLELFRRNDAARARASGKRKAIQEFTFRSPELALGNCVTLGVYVRLYGDVRTGDRQASKRRAARA